VRPVFICVFGILIAALCVQAGTGEKMLVRVYGDPGDLPRGLDVAGAKRFEWVDAVVNAAQLSELQREGRRIDVLIDDIEAHKSMITGVYHGLQEVMDSLAAIATNHPEIARLDTLPFITHEGRVLLALKISDNVNIEEDEVELFFTGLHHAREWPTINVTLFLADTLTGAYGIDPHITDVVDSRQIWVMPCVNPDGYFYCYDQGHDWRKNRTYFPQYGTRGVDPNRNYDGACNGSPLGQWGSNRGQTSRYPDTEIYDGPSPASEAEIKATNYLINEHDFVFSVNYHTYGEMVIWPWAYTSLEQVPDDELLIHVGEEMASRITQQDGSGVYDAFQSSGPGMYETSGDAADWSYGYTFYEKGSNLLPYTVETCQSFHPNEAVLDQVVRENFDAVIYLCDVADSVRNAMVPYVLPPVVAPLDTISPPDFDIVWTERNPLANAEMYELEERMGFLTVVDSAESGTGLWDMQGFSISSARVHDGTYSFYSSLGGGASDTAVAMTTKHPLPVKAGDSLTFWYYANIEDLWDYAYVEVSRDGMAWDILEFFTGTKGWDRLAYSLEGYVGGSVFFRFRYAKDDMDPGSYEGIYIDAVSPVATFDSVGIVSSAISDTFWSFVGKDPGEYWYRVKGYNTARDWGHFGQLIYTQVPTGIAEEKHRWKTAMFQISQNIPNPFATSTAIVVLLPGDAVASDMKIFDCSGRVVKTLELTGGSADEYSSAVRYELNWDGTDNSGGIVPSGIYFCGLSSPDHRIVRKMVLAR
jgi:carboxypeptidase T